LIKTEKNMNIDKPLRIVIAGGNGSLGLAIMRQLPFSAEYTISAEKRSKR
jgi:dTDP-4-dehydrorhamnose reductase